MCYEIVLYPDVIGRAQSETSLVFWHKEYCNRKRFLTFGCSEMWSMAMLCYCLAGLSYNDS